MLDYVIRNARVPGAVTSPLLTTCVCNTVRRWRFPRFKGAALDVTLPLRLAVRD